MFPIKMQMLPRRGMRTCRGAVVCSYVSASCVPVKTILSTHMYSSIKIALRKDE